MNKADMVSEARQAIEDAKRKHQRWVLWQDIVDEWESDPGESEVRFHERLRIAKFVADNQDTLREFAGERTGEMLVFMLERLHADIDESEVR